MGSNDYYPKTLYESAPPVDLSSRAVRDRLKPDAVRAFFNIMDRWGVRSEDARRLLGGMSNGAYFTLKKGGGRDIGEDRLRRISYLIGVFKALNVLYGAELADRWMKLPNSNRIFGGGTPLEYLLRGGMPAFATLQKLLEARRVGH